MYGSYDKEKRTQSQNDLRGAINSAFIDNKIHIWDRIDGFIQITDAFDQTDIFKLWKDTDTYAYLFAKFEGKKTYIRYVNNSMQHFDFSQIYEIYDELVPAPSRLWFFSNTIMPQNTLDNAISLLSTLVANNPTYAVDNFTSIKLAEFGIDVIKNLFNLENFVRQKSLVIINKSLNSNIGYESQDRITRREVIARYADKHGDDVLKLFMVHGDAAPVRTPSNPPNVADVLTGRVRVQGGNI